jgi:hypothetical protein
MSRPSHELEEIGSAYASVPAPPQPDVAMQLYHLASL